MLVSVSWSGTTDKNYLMANFGTAKDLCAVPVK